MFLDNIIYNNTILEWLISFGIVLLGFILAKIIFKGINIYLKKVTKKTRNTYDDIIVDKIEEPITVLIIIASYLFAVNYVKLPDISNILFNFGIVSIILTITWMLTRTISALADEFGINLSKKTDNSFYEQILPLIKKTFNIVVWSLGIIIALDNVGVDVTAMIAGLGVGGLALALAAQDIIKNIFGGVMIFLDKPFKIGERIQVDGYDGTVEEIGLRSTRIRTLDSRIVTIPNSSFSDNSVTNVTSEPFRKIVTKLGLTYDMTPEQMDLAITLINQIATNEVKNDNVTENFSIGFNNFGDFSLGIIFVYQIVDGKDILAVQTIINKEILSKFNENNLTMAFPTQTVYTINENN